MSNPNDWLTHLMDTPLSADDSAERQRARITTAEAALAGGWTAELGDVLGMLGLDAA